MSALTQSLQSEDSFNDICDWGMVYSLSALVFVLPASIALLDSFAALAISFYLTKKINGIVIHWPVKGPSLNFVSKLSLGLRGICPPVKVLDLPLRFLTLAMFSSVVFSQYPTLSLFAFVGKFLKCVFLYFSLLEALSDGKRMRIFLGSFLLSAFIVTLSGVCQHYTGKDFIKGHLIGTENLISTHRINSSFFGANALGAYLLPLIGLMGHLLYSLFTQRLSISFGKMGWVSMVLAAFFLSLLLACLCWTYSRSSWIGYLVILFLMVVLDRRKIFYAGALFLVFIFIFLPSLDNVRHMELIRDNSARGQHKESIQYMIESGGSGRMAHWEQALSIIRSSPFCGTGLNTYARIIKRDPNQKTWWYAHNGYLQMAAETGLFGLSCFLGLLLAILWHGIRSCKQIVEPWSLTVLQGVLCGFVGLLAQGFFDNTFFTVQLSMLLWLMIGVIIDVPRLALRDTYKTETQ